MLLGQGQCLEAPERALEKEGWMTKLILKTQLCRFMLLSSCLPLKMFEHQRSSFMVNPLAKILQQHPLWILIDPTIIDRSACCEREREREILLSHSPGAWGSSYSSFSGGLKHKQSNTTQPGTSNPLGCSCRSFQLPRLWRIDVMWAMAEIWCGVRSKHRAKQADAPLLCMWMVKSSVCVGAWSFRLPNGKGTLPKGLQKTIIGIISLWPISCWLWNRGPMGGPTTQPNRQQNDRLTGVQKNHRKTPERQLRSHRWGSKGIPPLLGPRDLPPFGGLSAHIWWGEQLRRRGEGVGRGLRVQHQARNDKSLLCHVFLVIGRCFGSFGCLYIRLVCFAFVSGLVLCQLSLGSNVSSGLILSTHPQNRSSKNRFHFYIPNNNQ